MWSWAKRMGCSLYEWFFPLSFIYFHFIFKARTLTWPFPSTTVSRCAQHIPPTKARDLGSGKSPLGNPCIVAH